MTDAVEEIAEAEDAPLDLSSPTMTKKVVYLDDNVYEAAKKRVRHLIRTFDHCWISFSGGKDSMVVMELFREVMDEMGLHDKPVNFFFRDEEVIQDDVIETVRRYYDDPRYRGLWIACPQDGIMFIMGQHRPYIQWDRAREGRWVRPMPPEAVTSLGVEGDKPMYQTDMNAAIMNYLGVRGRIAVINGIRATESIMRFRSCIAKKNDENYINGDPGGAKNIAFCKPIFDWSETDVFKYFHQRGVKYAPIYDHQMMSGDRLRVSTPVHEMAFSTLSRLRATYPTFYEQIISIWPELLTHERYWSEYDRWAVIDKYPKTWTGMFQFIEETMEPDAQVVAKAAVIAMRKQKEHNRRSGKFSKGGCFGYPMRQVWGSLIGGTYRKGPIQTIPDPSSADIQFELAADAEAGAK